MKQFISLLFFISAHVIVMLLKSLYISGNQNLIIIFLNFRLQQKSLYCFVFQVICECNLLSEVCALINYFKSAFR